jgi:hypothetical protein
MSEARRICKRIRELQEEEKDSFSEIASAIEELEERMGDYGARKIIDRLNDSNSGTHKRYKSGGHVYRYKEFSGESEHMEFVNWANENRDNGFVLTVGVEEGVLMIHTADCPHIIPHSDDKKIASTYLCATDKGILRQEATKRTGSLEHCEHCGV